MCKPDPLQNIESYSNHLRQLHILREKRKANEKLTRRKRQVLSKSERHQVQMKTDKKCHICGGKIVGTWDADHVLSQSGGGEHAVSNYLPAHKICNNYRWDYLPEEFQEILRLGVFARTQIEKETRVGRTLAEGFLKSEKRRVSRRKGPASRPPGSLV